MTTKSDRIRLLYAEGKSVAEIAEIVGCRREYVRVAARQRANGSMSRADAKYSPMEVASREFVKQHGDRESARSAARTAYREAKDGGFSTGYARSLGCKAYLTVLRATAMQSIRGASQ